MIRFRQTRLAACVAVLLLLSMYVAPVVSSAAAAQSAPVKTVIVMPFQTPEDSPIETLGEDMAKSVTTGFGASGSIRAVLMTSRLPSIKRATDYDKSLNKSDLKGPFGTEKEQIQTALKIARETGADFMLVGSVDDIKADTDAKTGDIAVSTSLVDVKTGETIKTEVLTGQSADATGSATATDLVSMAAGDAVAKIVANMAISDDDQMWAMPTTSTVHRSSSKSGKGKWILGLLLAVGVGLAVGGNGGSSDDGSLDPPPPPP